MAVGLDARDRDFWHRCRAPGRPPSGDTPVVVEHFALVYPIG